MPRVELRLEALLHEKLLAAKPTSLSMPAFCSLLIEKTLDSARMLGGPSEAGTPSTSLLVTTKSDTYKNIYKAINEPINEITTPEPKASKRKPKAEGSPDFEAFWKQYQAIKRRASNQSKPKALEQWAKAIKKASPERLQQALTRAVQQQLQQERDGGFGSPFPDCFRWLRDGYFEAFLDGPAAAVPAAVSTRPIFDPNNPDDPF